MYVFDESLFDDHDSDHIEQVTLGGSMFYVGPPSKGQVRPGNPSADCCVAFSETEHSFKVMLQANAANNLDVRGLAPKDRAKFNEARRTEIQNLLDLKAYRLLSLSDSLEFRENYPEYVLPSRFVDRWKPTDDGGTKAKSRIVILGFKDPHVLQLERSAPTPTKEAFTTVLQSFASQQRYAWSSDIKNAFGQAAKTTRKQPIAASIPPGMLEAGFKDVDPRQLLLCETEVYGLISGQAGCDRHWLRTLKSGDTNEICTTSVSWP